MGCNKIVSLQVCVFSCVQIFATHSWPGSAVHVILQAITLKWVAIPFSRGLSWARNWTRVSCIAGKFFTPWATKEARNSGLYLIVIRLSEWIHIKYLEQWMAFSMGSINVVMIIENLKTELQSSVFLSSKAHFKRLLNLPTVLDLLTGNYSLLLVLECTERPTFVIFPLNSQLIRGNITTFIDPILSAIFI